MSSAIPVVIKHAGKSHAIDLDTSMSVPELKEMLYNKTGVAPARMKILIKGVLKDDASLAKLGIKEGQQITLIGTAGEIPKAPPANQIRFVEDMDESELAQAMKIPAGLQNMGNTCYMNSTVQVLRQIPELHTALNSYTENIASPDPERRLVAGLRDLYTGLDKTTSDYPPLLFWQMLRSFRPQFDQQDNHGHFSQQDAEECYNSIVTALKGTLGGRFAEKYMTGSLTTVTKSPEAPDEEATTKEEGFSNLTCSISSATNYLVSGLNEGFTQQIEKNSPSLGRNAMYTSTSTISRAPAYLTIHLNRFFWRPDIRKKTKIMRKIKFPFELDATEIMSDSAKAKVRHVNAKLKEVEKARAERLKVAKRTKADPTASTQKQNLGEDPGEAFLKSDEEVKRRAEEKAELEKLVNEDLKKDEGANVSGLYDLIGIVAHKGSSADGGHYMSWAKCVGKENSWFKFDDAKVSVVDDNSVLGLEGGGEGPVAYLLLYQQKRFD